MTKMYCMTVDDHLKIMIIVYVFIYLRLNKKNLITMMLIKEVFAAQI
ncbi:hypothetical protein Gromo_00448 [Candidatus Gromoviella agglomerans]|nr:hypothetical protein Gromo_00448 [Candidatus Gromoviella agglomerans]